MYVRDCTTADLSDFIINISINITGFDCRHPTEAALLPSKSLGPTDVSDYREELILSLSSARALANKHRVVRRLNMTNKLFLLS